jgi:glycine cleavage system transcriptional repressor
MRANAKNTLSRFVISVLVSDRVGILRDITTALADMGANVEGVTQTVLGGYFTVTLTVVMDSPRDADSVRDALLPAFPRSEASVTVRRLDKAGAPPPPVDGDRYIVTLTGPDRKGILKSVTAYLADKGINIEDWHMYMEGTAVTHIGEVTVPRRLDIQHLQNDFQDHVRKIALTASIQHENIFRVTNEVGAVQSLLAAGRKR